MSEDLEIAQKKFRSVRVFRFTPETLIYKMRDSSGERRFSVPYEAVDFKNIGALTVADRGIRQLIACVAFLVLLSGIPLQMFVSDSGVGIALLGFFAIMSGLVVAHFFGGLRVSYDLLAMHPVPPGANSATLQVIRNGERDAIVHELAKRRHDSLRRRFDANPLPADSQQAKAYLAWHRGNGVISDAEFANLSATPNPQSEGSEPSEAVH